MSVVGSVRSGGVATLVETLISSLGLLAADDTFEESPVVDKELRILVLVVELLCSLGVVNDIGADEVSSCALVVFDVLNVAPVDDSPASVAIEDSKVPFDVVWSSVVVRYAVGALLGLVLVYCEVDLVVFGAVVEEVDCVVAGTETPFSLSVGVFSTRVESTEVDACGVGEVSAPIDEVARAVVIVAVSDVEVNVEVWVSVVVEKVTVTAVVPRLPESVEAAAVVTVEVSVLLNNGTDVVVTGSVVVVTGSVGVVPAIVVVAESPVVVVGSSDAVANGAVVVLSALVDDMVVIAAVVVWLSSSVVVFSETRTDEHSMSCT